MLLIQEQKQQQKDELFYMSPTGHLSEIHIERVLQMKEAIKAKCNIL